MRAKDENEDMEQYGGGWGRERCRGSSGKRVDTWTSRKTLTSACTTVLSVILQGGPAGLLLQWMSSVWPVTTVEEIKYNLILFPNVHIGLGFRP